MIHLPHPLRARRHRRMVAVLDEHDPVERAFQALVIMHPETRPRTRGRCRKGRHTGNTAP